MISRPKEGQAHAASGITDSERLRRDILRDDGARGDHRSGAYADPGLDDGPMRNPDVIADCEGAARAFAPVCEADHRGDHATLSDGYQLVGLDGCIVEVGAVTNADFGSGVTDELRRDHPSDKSHPVPKPDDALIFDADRAVGVDTPSTLTLAERDWTANECYRAV